MLLFLCLHTHPMSAPALARQSLRLQPLPSRSPGELGKAGFRGGRGGQLRVSRYSVDPTSGHCLGHMNHLHGNQPPGVGWAPPAVAPTSAHAGSYCQASDAHPAWDQGLGGPFSQPATPPCPPPRTPPHCHGFVSCCFCCLCVYAGKVRKVQIGGDNRGNNGIH